MEHAVQTEVFWNGNIDFCEQEYYKLLKSIFDVMCR